MGSEVLKKFGRYFLLDMIAQGGMAEIYRAREQLIAGAEREVVIKRIQSGFSHNQEFVQMFKDEIKVTSQLNHPNIVQVFGGGEEDGQLYIAMELVIGKNLRQFINRFIESDRHEVPVELAVYVIEQVALGLKYAHTACDKKTDEPLRVVHRDISPQNILISFDGSVKVIDFGIAKSKSNAEATKVGIIKGKPSYLSPEQIQGTELDGRSDIFSLGAVLWESLTGKKLFAGENEMAVIRLIESASTHVKPPSTVNSKVPKELDAIVMKALQKNVDRRYQSAEELQRALHRFLYGHFPEFNPSDLAQAAKKLFHAEIVEDRKKLQRLNAEAWRLTQGTGISIVNDVGQSGVMLEDTPPPPVAAAVLRDASEDSTVSGLKPPSPIGTLTNGAGVKGSTLEVEKRPASSIQSGLPAQRLPGAPGSHGPGDDVMGSKSPGSAPPNRGNAFQSAKAGVAGRTFSGISGWIPRLAIVAIAVGIYQMAPQFGIQVPPLEQLLKSFESQPKKPVDSNVTQTAKDGHPAGGGEAPIPADRKTIPLRLNVIPSGGNLKIIVSGRPVSADNPVTEVKLDEPLELSVERPGFVPVRREFYVDSKRVKGLRESVVEVQLEPTNFGYLSVRTTPTADVVIQLEGSLWVRRSPFEREKLPAGRYTMKLINSILGMEKIMPVHIEEGKVINIDERLEVKD